MWKTLECSCHCYSKLIMKRGRTFFWKQLAQHSCLKIKESEIEFQESEASSKSYHPKGFNLITPQTEPQSGHWEENTDQGLSVHLFCSQKDWLWCQIKISPNSCAVVKAEGRPSSSITEQLLLGSHMVPTSAIPRVSHVVAPHRSCEENNYSVKSVMKHYIT